MLKVKKEIIMPSKIIVTAMVLMDFSQTSIIRELNKFRGVEMTEDIFHQLLLYGATGLIVPYLANVLDLYHYIPDDFQFIEKQPKPVKCFSVKEAKNRRYYGVSGI